MCSGLCSITLAWFKSTIIYIPYKWRKCIPTQLNQCWKGDGNRSISYSHITGLPTGEAVYQPKTGSYSKLTLLLTRFPSLQSPTYKNLTWVSNIRCLFKIQPFCLWWWHLFWSNNRPVFKKWRTVLHTYITGRRILFSVDLSVTLCNCSTRVINSYIVRKVKHSLVFVWWH